VKRQKTRAEKTAERIPFEKASQWVGKKIEESKSKSDKSRKEYKSKEGEKLVNSPTKDAKKKVIPFKEPW